MTLTGVIDTPRESLLKRTAAMAGSPTRYVLYVPLLFGLYVLFDLVVGEQSGSLHGAWNVLLPWLYNLVLNPLVWAAILGGIEEQQRARQTPASPSFLLGPYEAPAPAGTPTIAGMLGGVRRLFFRILGMRLLLMLLSAIVRIIVGLAIGRNNMESLSDEYAWFEAAAINILVLFWFAGMASGAGLWGGLWRGLKTLVRTALALGIAVIYGLAAFADQPASQAFARSGILILRFGPPLGMAAIGVACAEYAIALDREVNGGRQEAVPTDAAALQRDSKGFITASVICGAAAFVPLVHVLALLFGTLAMQRSRRFVWRSAIACVLGGFFTIAYGLLIAGLAIGVNRDAHPLSYTFLSESNSAVAPQVALLEDNSYAEAQQQLEAGSAGTSTRHWTLDAAMAIAKWRDGDEDGALDSFYAASQRKPDRSEFYYYYGVVLLQSGKADMAVAQFEQAAARSPELPVADRYLALSHGVYEVPPALSAGFYILILLILFPLHEYGHALASWKLGDDTARAQGRLTLNPIKHLDPFGSIVLPAILLFSHSQILFGWARPVPVNVENFKNPRKDHMRVSLAGPAVNLLIAMLCFVVLELGLLVIRVVWPDTLGWHVINPGNSMAIAGPPMANAIVPVIIFVKQLMYTSIALGIFNLVPIPPLDGSWILFGVLPQGMRNIFEFARRFGFVLLLLLANTPVLDFVLGVPIGFVWGAMRLFASSIGLG